MTVTNLIHLGPSHPNGTFVAPAYPWSLVLRAAPGHLLGTDKAHDAADEGVLDLLGRWALWLSILPILSYSSIPRIPSHRLSPILLLPFPFSFPFFPWLITTMQYLYTLSL